MSVQNLEPLVEVHQHNIALLFSNYLTSQNIASQVSEQQGQFVILCQAEYLTQAQAMFEQFAQNPHDEKYQQAAWSNGDAVDVQLTSEQNGHSISQQFLAHAGLVTLSIFALCWLVFIIGSFGFKGEMFSALRFYSIFSIEQVVSNPLRLIGPAFFHFSILHIAFNTMWWWQLGGAIEKVMGKWELLQLFLLSAIISNLGQFIVSGPNFGGLSGVVYAVLGYVWFAGWLVPKKGLNLPKAIVGFLLFWLVLGFVDMLPMDVANTAHLLGLLSGCGLAVFRFSGNSVKV